MTPAQLRATATALAKNAPDWPDRDMADTQATAAMVARYLLFALAAGCDAAADAADPPISGPKLPPPTTGASEESPP